MARIAAVADVFDAITSERPYARAAPPYVGVGAIPPAGQRHPVRPADSRELPQRRRALSARRPVLGLTDGRRGIVVSVPREAASTCPWCESPSRLNGSRIEAEDVDLREHPQLAPVLDSAAA